MAAGARSRSGGRRSSGSRGGHDAPTPGTPADLTPDADPVSVARSIVLRQLTAGPRTRAQLAGALARRGVPDDLAEQVLDRFEQVQLVDDAEFARQWVSSRHVGRGLARRALSHELRNRGVADETVREAVETIGDDDEVAAARDLVRRRLPGMAADDPARRTRRLAGMLARKGYSSAVAFRAIRESVEAAEAAGVLDPAPDSPDGGLSDGGLPDGGLPDGGLPDGGLSDGDPWGGSQ